MARSSVAPASPSSETSRARIKETALRLFSERGIDGVSVRDIVSAAKMKNGASLHYYFGSKDALIQELIIDCAIRSDKARLRRLEILEAQGGPARLGDIVRLLIESEVSLEDAGSAGGQMRFIMALQINHRDLVLTALDNSQHAAGYMRCVDHIRGFLAHMPAETARDRVVLMYIYIMATMAARESAREAPGGESGFWKSPGAIETIIATTCGLLEAPDTAATTG
ncbi:MAG: TetR/AcrR family transcriptional regulator [Alphaproteobacteria bacterium]|nr:TetR/AcrR family transcriptional regulator [Alphaproteobacteria bacterium]MBU1516373.1 TetR/AcrR family transcriptional regulator [Alphaproteobacteria bacterium]MBU2093390.1 TetR/AcrR family transcriptional regulator [Alphaproteobacteria bacterium]MBU2153877.1 TetR/AcrR family transcriptional regulator [Alphaproteobacteria bacterium]MBU2307749.1 TetR/AcrR family transcriptional regulator [Alphaproteobacteria bacterium]